MPVDTHALVAFFFQGDVVVLLDNSNVRVYRITPNGGYAETKYPVPAKPTAVAVSAEQGVVAVGDVRGVITFLYGPASEGRDARRTSC